MKKLIYTLLLSLPFLGTSCDREAISYDGSEGTLLLNVGLDDVTVVKTRMTEDESDSLKKICKIRIFDNGTLVRKYAGMSEVPTDGIKLVAGTKYSARVTAGDSIEATFEKNLFFEGKKEQFTIAGGNTTPVNIDCTIKNTLVKVNFDEIGAAASNCKMVIYATKGSGKSLEFNSLTADQTGYFLLPADSTKLYYEFSATAENGKSIESEGDFSANSATQYTLNCTFREPEGESNTTGAGMINLSISSEPISKVQNDMSIYQPPVITGMDASNNVFDPASGTNFEVGKGEQLSIWIATSCPLKSAVIECTKFSQWIGFNKIDITELSKSEKTSLENYGISIVERNAIGSATGGKGNVGVTFSADFMNQNIAASEGSTTIYFTAEDDMGNKRVLSWVITVSNDKIVTAQIDETDVWAHKTTLAATILNETTNAVTFQYRKVGDSNWTTVNAVKGNGVYTAAISGLTSNTTYEYRAYDGDKASSAICTFKTEEETQPKNAGFEDWCKSGSVQIPAASTDELWWDTGNHGSASVGSNITNPDSEIKHSGNYSAKLKSEFVVAKFAAGNIFVGKYLKTDGTNGILGWGREFNSRPTKLKGYVRYVTGTVDNVGDDSPISKGDTDMGQIYIAVGDWAGTYDSKTEETWPVIIRTKKSTRLLFDPEDSGIIGYGEKTFTENTSGDGMIEFEIPLDYRSNRKPKDIVIVASASKYGDYFSGSTSSTMWIDDFELVYE